MLEILVVPACFLGAGLIGYRLGTPPLVAGGLVAVGCSHLLSFLGADQALAAGDPAAAWIHLASQCLFLGGFVALVWLAATYPKARPSTVLVATAALLAVVGPLLAAISGPTPAVLDGTRQLGPIVHALPRGGADIGAAPLALLPLMAVVTFVLRYRGAGAADRAAMRWPIAGLALITALVVAGLLLRPESQGVVTALFLIGAPVFPLTLAFGPVVRHQQALSAELADVRERLARLGRPQPRPGVLERLTPREMSVLRGMAEGMANPVIARSMHLSLSSVEKHATSIFRKLEIPEGPEVHRRVAAVVAYRDALDESRG
jgi:DNA-binding CsgD family transcriptional regulator